MNLLHKRLRESIMRSILTILLVLATAATQARTLEVVPSLPQSPFPDTEVTTNISLRINSNTAQIFDLSLMTICSPSNSFQIAFGRDTDADNVLSPDETDIIYGWRGGRWFVEDFKGWSRQEVPTVADGTTRTLTVSFETRSNLSLRKFQITCENSPLFEEMLSVHSSCFFNQDWDLMRLTRRGALLDADNISLSIRNKGSLLYIR